MCVSSQAILESEPFGITLKTTQEAMKLGEDFVKELGCSNLDCLYKAVRQLLAQVLNCCALNFIQGCCVILDIICLSIIRTFLKLPELKMQYYRR